MHVELTSGNLTSHSDCTYKWEETSLFGIEATCGSMSSTLIPGRYSFFFFYIYSFDDRKLIKFSVDCLQSQRTIRMLP